MDDSQPSPERIMQLATGAWGAGILATGVIQSIFTHLDAGATTTQRVAQSAGLSERGTQALLDGLVGLGLVELIDGSYLNSAEASEFLVEGKPAYTGGYVAFNFADMGRWAGMPEAVRTGAPVAADTGTSPRTPSGSNWCPQSPFSPCLPRSLPPTSSTWPMPDRSRYSMWAGVLASTPSSGLA